MFAFLLFVCSCFADDGIPGHKFYIIPKEGNYTIDDTPILFTFNDLEKTHQDSHRWKTYNQCYEDKSYHFLINMTDEADYKERTYIMYYFKSHTCENGVPDKHMEFKYAQDVPTDGEYSHTDLIKKFPLWIHYSSSGHGSNENKLFQYSRPGCITPMGFEFRFTLDGCYHHLFPTTTCDGEDTIAKKVYEGEKYGSGVYHVNSTMVDGIDPKEEYFWAEGDRGFFTYLNLTEVTSYNIYDQTNPPPKYYQYTNDQLRIYKRRLVDGKYTYVYWIDAFRTPSIKKVLTTAIACPSRDDCTNSTEGWEYVITSECFAGQMFAYTCDQVVRLREEGYEENCENILKKGKTEVVLSSDYYDMFYYNETYFYVRQINIQCPKRSCSSTFDGMTTAYYYREAGLENVEGTITNMTYQYLIYNYKHYTVQFYFDENFLNVTGMKYIMPHSVEKCVDYSDIHIYRHNNKDECLGCYGYGVARAEYIELEKCINGHVYRIHGNGFIGVYKCNGDGDYSSNGNYDQNYDLELRPYTCVEFDGIVHFIWFDVSYSQFKNWGYYFTPADSEWCQRVNPAPPAVLDPVPEPKPIYTSSDEVPSDEPEGDQFEPERPIMPYNPYGSEDSESDSQSESSESASANPPVVPPVNPPEDDKHSSGNKDDNDDKQSSGNKDDGEYPPNPPVNPPEDDKHSSGNKDDNDDKQSSGNNDDGEYPPNPPVNPPEEDKQSSGNNDDNDDKHSSGNKDDNVESSTTQETPVTSESKTETDVKSESSKHEENVDSEEEGGNEGGNQDGSHSIVISALLVLMFFLF